MWEIGPGYRPITGWSTGRGYEREVEAQAYQKYRDDLDRVRQDAKKSADQAASVDLNVLRGRGAEFVLEFTAVVFLVFAVTILGLMNILKSEPIATLLAAIAGYVLGRASTRKQGREGTEEHVTVSTAEMTELVRAVAGIAKPAGQASQNEPATSKVPSGAPSESGK